MSTEQQAFFDLEQAITDLLSLGQVVSSIGPDSECPTEHLANVFGFSTLRLHQAWDRYAEARHAAKSTA